MVVTCFSTKKAFSYLPAGFGGGGLAGLDSVLFGFLFESKPIELIPSLKSASLNREVNSSVREVVSSGSEFVPSESDRRSIPVWSVILDVLFCGFGGLRSGGLTFSADTEERFERAERLGVVEWRIWTRPLSEYDDSDIALGTLGAAFFPGRLVLKHKWRSSRLGSKSGLPYRI